MKVDSNVSAPTKFVQVGNERYAYRRFGNGSGLPLLFLQRFTGTLDNWDPAVTDPLAAGREVILFDNAGIGRASGRAPQTIAGIAEHALALAGKAAKLTIAMNTSNFLFLLKGLEGEKHYGKSEG